MAHHKGNKDVLGVTVQPQLIKELDAYRGLVPRSRIVEKALNECLERERQKKTGEATTTPTTKAAAVGAAAATT